MRGLTSGWRRVASRRDGTNGLPVAKPRRCGVGHLRQYAPRLPTNVQQTGDAP